MSFISRRPNSSTRLLCSVAVAAAHAGGLDQLPRRGVAAWHGAPVVDHPKHMGASINGESPKWMVYRGKSHWKWMITGGTRFFFSPYGSDKHLDFVKTMGVWIYCFLPVHVLFTWWLFLNFVKQNVRNKWDKHLGNNYRLLAGFVWKHPSNIVNVRDISPSNSHFRTTALEKIYILHLDVYWNLGVSIVDFVSCFVNQLEENIY